MITYLKIDTCKRIHGRSSRNTKMIPDIKLYTFQGMLIMIFNLLSPHSRSVLIAFIYNILISSCFSNIYNETAVI